MTYDLSLGYCYLNNDNVGEDSYETFRLPQPDGTIKEFERNSIMEKGDYHRRYWWPTFKARYSTDKVTIQNIIGATFNKIPVNSRAGYVAYLPEISPRSDYSNSSNEKVNSLTYTGYWNFIFNDRNTLSFSPNYGYSHTVNSSQYAETDAGTYNNAASDDSHKLSADVDYSLSFGEWGKMNLLADGIILHNRTTYSGTANRTDNTHTYRLSSGASYSLSKGGFYTQAGLGLTWQKQRHLEHSEESSAPWADFSLQYSPNDRHRVSGEFHYHISVPSSSYLSTAIIESNPLMSYTGNPDLKPYKSYDVNLSYVWIPDKKWRFSTYASMWAVQDRYVYDYVPYANGILRTIVQPGGGYTQWWSGINGSCKLLDRKLQLSGRLSVSGVHNGWPHNYNKFTVDFYLMAHYYLDNWSFSAAYMSPQGYPNGCMVGTWKKSKSYLSLQAAWANASWNIGLQTFNFTRWNWKSERSVMHSLYYNQRTQAYSFNDHALAKLYVIYTFGFGKKVERGDEVSQQSGIGSGILK